jgi:hypothetical protein
VNLERILEPPLGGLADAHPLIVMNASWEIRVPPDGVSSTRVLVSGHQGQTATLAEMPDDDVPAGWYLDPYGVHEQRWISAGRPTALVRDDGRESKDEPPDRPPTLPFIAAPVDDSLGWRDTLRADDLNRQPSPDLGSYSQAAFDGNAIFNSSLPGPAPSGDRTGMMFETPFQRAARRRARKKRWVDRWHRIFGH